MKSLWYVEADDVSCLFDTREAAINYFKEQAKFFEWDYIKTGGYNKGWVEYICTCRRFKKIKPFKVTIFKIPYKTI